MPRAGGRYLAQLWKGGGGERCIVQAWRRRRSVARPARPRRRCGTGPAVAWRSRLQMGTASVAAEAGRLYEDVRNEASRGAELLCVEHGFDAVLIRFGSCF